MTPPTAEAVLATLRELQAHDLPAHGGRTLAYVYDSGLADADAVGLEALAMFAASNGLDPTAFPSLLRMENDLVALTGGLLDAPAGFAGSVTSGGTESILLAVLAARQGSPGTSDPSMVLPTSAHAAFHKAAEFLGVRAVLVDVDADTLRADPVAMADAVDHTTVLVVASAPSYAHGVVDPVTEVAAMAADRGVRCHVDACIGGWVLPHLDDAPPWTFAVEGVTSISVDLHKYAYTPKGVSVLLHATPALRRGHFFASANWPGYTMLNSTMQSTRSGGPLAAAWAVTQRIGIQGYADLARQARDATLAVATAVDGIDGLSVLTAPDSTLVALVADTSCDVFTIADEMLERGWFVQPQLSFRGVPPTLHLTLSAATAPSVPELVVALRESTDAARAAGPVPLDPGLAALLGSIDPATLDEAGFARSARRRRAGGQRRSARAAEPDGPGQRPARRVPCPTARGAAGWRARPPVTPDRRLTAPRPPPGAARCPSAPDRLPRAPQGYWLGPIQHRSRKDADGTRDPRPRPLAHGGEGHAGAARADHRRQPRRDGGPGAGARRTRRPRDRHPDDVCRAGRRGRPARPGAGGGRHRQGRPRRHLGAELRRVGADPVRDRQGRRDPGQHQPGLPLARARLRAQPGRHPR